MTESNFPNKYDAVLGGKTPVPINAAVLGGLAGVKLRLASSSIEQRVAALPESLKYGEAGLDLVIAALQNDESLEIRKTAYLLLQPIQEQKIQSVLKQYWKFLGTTDYTQLQNLLAGNKWKEADEETRRVMLKVASRESEGCLNYKSMDNFPCSDLRTINQLWLDYSYGRFGFSVQKQIWLECGGKIDSDTQKALGDRCGKIDYDTQKALGDRLGWRVNGSWIGPSNIRYSLDAPPGHLPVSVGSCVGLGWGVVGMAEKAANFSRVQNCQL